MNQTNYRNQYFRKNVLGKLQAWEQQLYIILCSALGNTIWKNNKQIIIETDLQYQASVDIIQNFHLEKFENLQLFLNKKVEPAKH